MSMQERLESDVVVVGLGAMGLPMAQRLAERYRVVGYDVAEERLEAAARVGVVCTRDLPAALSSGRMLVLAVRDERQMEAVLFGPGAEGLIDAGSVVVLTSTVGPEAACRAGSRLQDRDVMLVDAPVSGGAVRARRGELLVMAGGPQEVVEKSRPLLEQLASRLFLAGPSVGDGQTLKVVNQLLCGVHTAAAAEAIALARQLGLDLPVVIELLLSGAAASFMLGDRGPRMVDAFDGSPEVRSRLDVISKDMGIVAEVARRSGVATPVAAAAEQLYRTGLNRGLAALDDSTIVRVLVPGQSGTLPAEGGG